MSRIISIVNQKGGVGKTTTATNLSSFLAYFGKSVLLVDIDPQANATSGIGLSPKEIPASLYEVLLGPSNFREIIQPTSYESLKIAPSSQNLAGANVELVIEENREFKLGQALSEVKDDFEFIIIDSPPSLGLLTINGLVASKEVLIPVQCEYYALEGLSSLMQTINLVKENLKPDLEILGALLTMYDDRQKLSQEVFDEIYRYFPHKIFRSVIPRCVRLAEAPSFGKSIRGYDPKSRGAKAYERLAREILMMEE